MPRKSPTESATQFKVGTKKKGNDGNMWEVKTTKAGVKRWTKIKSNNELNIDCNNFVRYEKRTKSAWLVKTFFIEGLQT
jgi:hypothetical protein